VGRRSGMRRWFGGLHSRFGERAKDLFEFEPSAIVPLMKRLEGGSASDHPSVTAAGRATEERPPEGRNPTSIEIPADQRPVCERLAEDVDDLGVFYAFDNPHNFVYLSPSKCEELGIGLGDLRALAVENLRRRRKQFEAHTGATCAMVVVDGDLEASLLVADDLWDANLAGPLEQVRAAKYPGELVVAAPARDLLLLTGSDTPGGVEELRAIVAETWADSDPRRLLTQALLVRRDGRWERFG
jgi:hypothetical protein